MNDDRKRHGDGPFQADNDGTPDTQEPRPKVDSYRTILPPEEADATDPDPQEESPDAR